MRIRSATIGNWSSDHERTRDPLAPVNVREGVSTEMAIALGNIGRDTTDPWMHMPASNANSRKRGSDGRLGTQCMQALHMTRDQVLAQHLHA